jgi:hypothetical protein
MQSGFLDSACTPWELERVLGHRIEFGLSVHRTRWCIDGDRMNGGLFI